jgi:hypothetical protein
MVLVTISEIGLQKSPGRCTDFSSINEDPARIEISFPNGVRLSFPAGTNISQLKTLINY